MVIPTAEHSLYKDALGQRPVYTIVGTIQWMYVRYVSQMWLWNAYALKAVRMAEHRTPPPAHATV